MQNEELDQIDQPAEAKPLIRAVILFCICAAVGFAKAYGAI